MGTCNAVDEVTVQGLTLMYDTRSRFRCVIRVGDMPMGAYPAMGMSEHIARINAFMEGLMGDDLTISRSVKTTLETGYLLSFDVGVDGRSAIFTAELIQS